MIISSVERLEADLSNLDVSRMMQVRVTREVY